MRKYLLRHSCRSKMKSNSGFSLIELLTVVAIIAILAAVGIPSYINYRNRAIQSEAVEALLRAKMDQEVYYSEHYGYADTITKLYSFGDTNGANSYTTAHGYVLSVDQANTDDDEYRITASKTIYAYASADTMAITNVDDYPVIHNADALKFSIFKWLFES